MSSTMAVAELGIRRENAWRLVGGNEGIDSPVVVAEGIMRMSHGAGLESCGVDVAFICVVLPAVLYMGTKQGHHAPA